MPDTLGDWLGRWVAQADSRPPLPTPPRETLGQRLRRLREAHRYSADDLIALFGVDYTRQHICMIERGRVRDPGVGFILKVARAYGVTVEQLMEGLTDG